MDFGMTVKPFLVGLLLAEGSRNSAVANKPIDQTTDLNKMTQASACFGMCHNLGVLIDGSKHVLLSTFGNTAEPSSLTHNYVKFLPVEPQAHVCFPVTLAVRMNFLA